MDMRFTSVRLGTMAAAVALAIGVPSTGGAQQAETGPGWRHGPGLHAASRHRDPMREAIALVAQGNTVVLAFFKARTKG
jgi:hypothetical protein